jgi:hypothetical protein
MIRYFATSFRSFTLQIISSVQFRPNKPFELVSGGLDTIVVHWNYKFGNSINIYDPVEPEEGMVKNRGIVAE